MNELILNISEKICETHSPCQLPTHLNYMHANCGILWNLTSPHIIEKSKHTHTHRHKTIDNENKPKAICRKICVCLIMLFPVLSICWKCCLWPCRIWLLVWLRQNPKYELRTRSNILTYCCNRESEHTSEKWIACFRWRKWHSMRINDVMLLR